MSNTVNTLSGNTRVPFTCQHCGACCRDVEEKIMLEPYDAYRLGRFLREREDIESIEDVYAKYAHAVMLSDGFPIFVLNTVGKEQCCIFLQDGNCSVYDARLKVCRLYPFTVDFGQRGKRFSYYQCLDKHAAHFRGGMVRINDWRISPKWSGTSSIWKRTCCQSWASICADLGRMGRKPVYFPRYITATTTMIWSHRSWSSSSAINRRLSQNWSSGSVRRNDNVYSGTMR